MGASILTGGDVRNGIPRSNTREYDTSFILAHIVELTLRLIDEFSTPIHVLGEPVVPEVPVLKR